jgi:peptidoglycan lytic transglycosylase F
MNISFTKNILICGVLSAFSILPLNGCSNSNQLADPVDRDFSEITISDTLRVVTFNHPITYYLYRGTRRGFDFELIQKFAEEKNLFLEVIVAPTWSDMIPYLYEGKGDVIASMLTITPERAEKVEFTRSYLEVWQVAVGTEDSPAPQSMDELNGREILVRKGSSYDERLRELQNQGLNIDIVYLDEESTPEPPIQLVARGKHQLTIADNLLANLEQQFYPGLDMGVSITEPQQVGWAVRPNSLILLEELNSFLTENDRSAFFNILKKRYFTNTQRFLRHRTAQMAQSQDGKISNFDDIYRDAVTGTTFDWRFIAAQSYHESRFQEDLVSWAGAVGLMQLMPRTAESVGVKDIYDPSENIFGGVKYMQLLYDRYESISNITDRTKMVLAAYNAGPTHLYNARKLAKARGGDPNSWSDVAVSFSLLERPEYYNKDGYSFVRGRSVRRYVADVFHRYAIFSDLVEEDHVQEEEFTTAVFSMTPFQTAMDISIFAMINK